MLGCTVYANDINPECFKWMNINLKKNQPKKFFREYHVSNLDGREFLRTIALPHIEGYQKEVAIDSEKRRYLSNSKIVILMNLPELALTFLDVISEWLSINVGEKNLWVLPIHIYCYTFSKADDCDEDIRMRLKTVLPDVKNDQISCRFVRQVAPKKDMMCAHVRLFEMTKNDELLSTKKTDDKDETVKRFKQDSSE
jgi:tRNA (guanine37-N1)-methyltransferase